MGKVAYTDQILSECLRNAKGRVRILKRLDAQLKEPSSSLG